MTHLLPLRWPWEPQDTQQSIHNSKQLNKKELGKEGGAGLGGRGIGSFLFLPPTSLISKAMGLDSWFRESQARIPYTSWDGQGKSKYRWPLFHTDYCYFSCQGRAGEGSLWSQRVPMGSWARQRGRKLLCLDESGDTELLCSPLVSPAWQQWFKQGFLKSKSGSLPPTMPLFCGKKNMWWFFKLWMFAKSPQSAIG